jgi:hypothetical protein
MRKERSVATVVVLFPVSNDEPQLRPSVLEELARLGITSISLLRDPSLAALVLEGWAFDPRETPHAARAVVGRRDELRVLGPVAQMSLSAAAVAGGDGKESR